MSSEITPGDRHVLCLWCRGIQSGSKTPVSSNSVIAHGRPPQGQGGDVGVRVFGPIDRAVTSPEWGVMNVDGPELLCGKKDSGVQIVRVAELGPQGTSP